MATDPSDMERRRAHLVCIVLEKASELIDALRVHAETSEMRIVFLEAVMREVSRCLHEYYAGRQSDRQTDHHVRAALAAVDAVLGEIPTTGKAS